MSNDRHPWTFRRVIPVAPFARHDADVIDSATTNPDPLDTARSPYRGVDSGADPDSGSGYCRVILETRDLFGNAHPQGNATVDIPLGYTDPIFGIADWPGVQADYTFERDAGGDVYLLLHFEFDLGSNDNADDDNRDLIREHRQRVTRVYYQLVQRDLEVRVVTSMHSGGEPSSPEVAVLSSAAKQTIVAFVSQLHAYFTALLTSPPATAAAPLPTVIRVRIVPPSSQRLFPLTVALELARNPHAIDPRVRDMPGAARVATPLAPRSVEPPHDDDSAQAIPETSDEDKDEKGRSALRAFAARFESTFPGWKLAAVAGHQRRAGEGMALWVLDFSNRGIRVTRRKNSQGDHEKPRFLTPAPLSTRLLSRSKVPIRLYQPEVAFNNAETREFSFEAIDLDTWLAQCLELIDMALSPRAAVVIASLDRSDALAALLTAKTGIAQIVSRRLAEVIVQREARSLTHEEIAASAAVLTKSMHARLSNAYEVDTVMWVPYVISGANGLPSCRLVVDAVANAGSQNRQDQEEEAFTISQGLLPLGSDKSDTGVAFLFDVKANRETFAESFSLDIDLVFRGLDCEVDSKLMSLSFIDPIRTPVAAQAPPMQVETTEPSVQIETSLGRVAVPIALRSYPPDPILIAQAANAAVKPSADLAASKQWYYDCLLAAEYNDQDNVHLLMDFNAPAPTLQPQSARAATADPADWVEALAQIHVVYEAMRAELTLLEKFGNPDAGIEPDRVANAVAFLVDVIEPIGSLQPPAPPPTVDPDQAATPGVYRYHFEIETAGANFESVTWRRSQDNSDALLPELKLELDDGTMVSLPEVTPANEPVDGWVSLSYRAADKDATVLFPVRSIKQYHMRFTGRDIVYEQSVLTAVWSTRNLTLVDSPTDRAFIYRTPTVQFPSRLTPYLQGPHGISLGRWQGGNLASELATALRSLFSQLFDRPQVTVKTAAGHTRFGPIVDLTCRYGYRLVSGPMAKPVLTFVPIAFVPRKQLHQPSAGGVPGDDMATALAGVLTQWYEENQPHQNGGGFYIDLQLYSNLNESQPKPIFGLSEMAFMLGNIKECIKNPVDRPSALIAVKNGHKAWGV